MRVQDLKTEADYKWYHLCTVLGANFLLLCDTEFSKKERCIISSSFGSEIDNVLNTLHPEAKEQEHVVL